MLGFGGGAVGPGFGFTELVLELVEYFIDAQAGLVERGQSICLSLKTMVARKGGGVAGCPR